MSALDNQNINIRDARGNGGSTPNYTHNVTLKLDSEKAYRDRYKALDSRNVKKPEDKYIANFDLNVWNGNTGMTANKRTGAMEPFRGTTNASIVVNMAKNSNVFANERELKNVQANAGRVGGYPVGVEGVRLTQNLDGSPIGYYTTMDLGSLAVASADEKNKAAAEQGRPQRADGKRSDVSMRYSVTEGGIGAGSESAFKNAIGKIALQNVVFTGGMTKPNPEAKAVPTDPKAVQATVDKVSAFIAKEYNAFMKDVIDGKKGTPLKTQARDGKEATEIAGSEITMTGFKIAPVGKRDSGKYAVVLDDATSKLSPAQTAEIRNIGDRFNKELSQKINNPQNGFDKEFVKLANLANVTPYAAELRDADGFAVSGAEGKLALHPAVTANFQPYTSALVKAIDVATYGKDDPKFEKQAKEALGAEATEAEIASKSREIRQADATIANYFSGNKSMESICKTLSSQYYADRTPEAAKAEHTKALKDFTTSLNIKEVQADGVQAGK